MMDPRKVFYGNLFNFNEPPTMWNGQKVFNTSNLHGHLNVVKHPKEPFIPNITTDGNLKVNLNATINKKLTVNSDTHLNKKLLLANCGNVAKRIDRADGLPSSDKKLKTNITPIENALDKVLSLEGVEFDFIEGAKTGYLGVHQIGLIAQDVKKVIPEVVGKNTDGNLGLSYQHLVPLLIEAIKEQQKEIEELKKIIKEK